MAKRLSTKQHDAPESRAAMEKRLGITAETRKAADRYATSKDQREPCLGDAWAYCDFLAGAAWERRRRARKGY